MADVRAGSDRPLDQWRMAFAVVAGWSSRVVSMHAHRAARIRLDHAAGVGEELAAQFSALQEIVWADVVLG